MNKRINYIKEIQKALELFSDGARILDEAIEKCTEANFRNTLNDYLKQYAKLNFDFSSYLIYKLGDAYQKDKNDIDFNQIIKDLE